MVNAHNLFCDKHKLMPRNKSKNTAIKALQGNAVTHRTKVSTSFWQGAVLTASKVWWLSDGQGWEGGSMAFPPHLGHPQGPSNGDRWHNMASGIIRWLPLWAETLVLEWLRSFLTSEPVRFQKATNMSICSQIQSDNKWLTMPLTDRQ